MRVKLETKSRRHSTVATASRATVAAMLFLAFFLSPTFFAPSVDSGSGTLIAGRTARCAHCGRKITGRYIQYGGKAYCSKACWEASLPKCSVCGRPATMTSSDGKHYCSKACLEKTWPVCSFCGKHSSKGVYRGWGRKFLCARCALLPKCFACGMPGVARLPDGRLLCRDCAKTAVLKRSDMLAVVGEVRKLMRDKLGLSTAHGIAYGMVDAKGLAAETTGGGNNRELGLFRFALVTEKTTTKKTLGGKEIATRTKERVKSRKYSIFFLSGIPLSKLREVAGHELAHDWMQEKYPHIADLKLKEGWAEFVASKINELYGQGKMNVKMERNPDKIYGDGYRYVKAIVEKGGIEALIKVFEKAEAEGRKAEEERGNR